MLYLLIFFFAVAAMLYFSYAGIIQKRNRVNEALAGIDVQLKQRLDLIPNILTIAKKFLDHEKGLLTEITELRQKTSAAYDKSSETEVRDYLSNAEQLSNKMGQLKVTVENYPDLKSDHTMVQAMQTYNEIEAQISAARRFYNSAVSELNSAVQIFPGNIIAGYAGVTAMPFYKAEEAVSAPINADQYLN